MHLKSLSVVNFKNIREAAVEFSPRLNALIGNNGAGKTNILDALYALSFSKSCFNTSDLMNVTHEENWFMLQGKYQCDDKEETIVYGYQNGQKKQLKRNGKLYKRLADHIGLFPLVMVSPSDSNLVVGGSDERRKFMDGVISQYNSAYLEGLIRYNRVLLQRNNLLRQVAPGRKPDGEMLDFYNGELIRYGEEIHRLRNEFIRNLIPVFQQYYTFIAGGHEIVGLEYLSGLSTKPFDALLRDSIAADLSLQYTTEGIHKDDLTLTIGGYPLKKTGSQGQQKTYLVALKLAQFEFIRKLSGINPILLLDDIFDKLDKERVEQIVTLVSGDQFGQIFITDTNRDHLDSIIQGLTPDFRIFRVTQGIINLIR